MAGPKRPQDRVELPDVKKNFLDAFPATPEEVADCAVNGDTATASTDGAVVIAAITSCTNTSNPIRHAGRRPAGQEGGGARPNASRG